MSIVSKTANLSYTSYYMTKQYYPAESFKIWRKSYGIKEELRDLVVVEKDGMLCIKCSLWLTFYLHYSRAYAPSFPRCTLT